MSTQPNTEESENPKKLDIFKAAFENLSKKKIDGEIKPDTSNTTIESLRKVFGLKK